MTSVPITNDEIMTYPPRKNESRSSKKFDKYDFDDANQSKNFLKAKQPYLLSNTYSINDNQDKNHDSFKDGNDSSFDSHQIDPLIFKQTDQADEHESQSSYLGEQNSYLPASQQATPPPVNSNTNPSLLSKH